MLLPEAKFWPEFPMTQNKQQVVAAKDQDAGQLQHFITSIKTAEQQVGEHIVRSLQHPGTVAVLTTVGVGPDGNQSVISAALTGDQMEAVQALLSEAEIDREYEEACIGFHCLPAPKATAEPEGDAAAKPAQAPDSPAE